MKHLTVGIFHDIELGRELGKRGTESDILMFNRKTDDCIYTFMAPVDNKLSAKAQIMSEIDAAIISFAEVTPEVGETIVMLDTLSIMEGVAIIPPNSVLNEITALTKGTVLESYHVKPREPLQIFDGLDKIEPKRKNDSPVEIVIDHAFSVKGVGEVALAVVTKGIVKKHDKLQLLPAGKEVVIRSIQMHDKDFDSAEAGCRVGLCIKGANVDEMKRGSVICATDDVKMEKKFNLSFESNKFYKDGSKEGNFHVSVGMQVLPVAVSDVAEGSLTIEAEKPIVYNKDDKFLLLDINADKMHIIGKGKVE